MNTKLTMSLKSAFDNLELIPEFEERYIGTPEDIIKKRIVEDRSDNYEDMTKFNLKIINDRSWGYSISDKTVNDRYNRLKPKKLAMKDLQKEVSKYK
jgi:hypothetical protein